MRLAIVIALLALNVGVILYHGDPRDLMAEVRAKEGVGRAEETERVVSSTEPRAQVREAKPAADELDVVLPELVPGVVSDLDATRGMRVPGVVQRVEELELASGQTVAAALDTIGVSSQDVHEALQSLTEVVNFRRLRPGNLLKARFNTADQLVELDIHSSAVDRARAERGRDGWHGRALDVTVQSVESQVSGEVRFSLWDALITAGEQPKLVSDIVGIFGWDIDFYRDTQTGDTFRLLVDKRFVDGEFIGYGDVHAAEFTCAGDVHRAFRFERSDGTAAYYDEQGRSMRKQLLKSPLEYGRVTSGYGNRRHPILGYSRRHNGVDYGVPTGTPVWTVGDGVVSRAGRVGGFGKLIEVRHPNGWLSQYAHLSSILVRAGQRVSQKDVIGRVGSTGMSTGPHLHYGLKHHGGYVNPATQKFERGKPLKGEDLERFEHQIIALQERLDEMHIAQSVPTELAKEG